MSSLARVVAFLFTWKALARAGAVLGFVAGSVLRIRRSMVTGAMTRAGVPDAERAATSMYRDLGAGVFELLWLAGKSDAERAAALRENVVLDDALLAEIDAACARGPLIFAASHTANWELVAFGAAQALEARGRRLAVVVKPQSVGVVDAFCTRLRQACGVVLVAPDGAFGAARRLLAAGDVVAMPIDQVPGRTKHGIQVSFLGAPAHADRSIATLARATGATLLVVGASRDGRMQRVHLLGSLRADDTNRGATSWIASATREATRLLEAFVASHPSSWLWMHRRWRAPFERGTGGRGRDGAGPLVATGHPG